MTLDPITKARVEGARAAILRAAAEVAKADDPVAIRHAITRLWSAGHIAYQATLDAENASRMAALAKLENAA